MVAMLASGQVANAETSHGKGKAEPSKDYIQKKGSLRQVRELPGKAEVSHEIQQELKNSTVKIIMRHKTEKNEIWGWYDNCTGIKVSHLGQDYILTAAHCFSDTTGTGDLSVNNLNLTGLKAANYKDVGELEYGIADPNLPLEQRNINPIANVTDTVIDTHYKDLALLKVIPNKDVESADGTYASTYENIPAIELDSISPNYLGSLMPGDKVSMVGIPSSSGSEIIAGIGTYLGTLGFANPDGSYGSFNVVGIDPNAPENDGCEFGASGSTAITNRGELLGVLSLRANYSFKYDEDVMYERQTEAGQNPSRKQIHADAVNYWHYLEHQLNVSFKGFKTICLYTPLVAEKNNDGTTSDDLTDLVNGVNQSFLEYVSPASK